MERARDAIRVLKKNTRLAPGGVAVNLHGGVYELTRTFELTAADSGSESAPVVYRCSKGEELRLSGGRWVTDWKPVTDPAVMARLDPAARGKEMQADLRALGVSSFGMLGGGFGLKGGPGLELFFNDEPMTLSRYPNEGFIKIASVEGTTAVTLNNTQSYAEGVFTYESDRPDRWTSEKEGWVLGNWFHDWAEGTHRIAAIDVASKRMTLAKPHHVYGYRKGQWFYGFNLLCEIDRPGE